MSTSTTTNTATTGTNALASSSPETNITLPSTGAENTGATETKIAAAPATTPEPTKPAAQADTDENVGAGMDLSAFTAQQAQRLAASVYEQEGAPKLQEIRKDCVAQIKQAIAERQKECLFEIPVAQSVENPMYSMNSYLCESLVKHLERELGFVILRRFSFHASRIVIRWHHEGTRALSVDELQRLRSEAERKKLTFSVYHALLSERELQSHGKEQTLQQLSREAVKAIIHNIHKHVPSFVFEVPFVKYAIYDGRDRNELYEGLIEQLKKGGFEVSDQMKTAYKFRIRCIPDPETISIEETSSSSSSSLSSSSFLAGIAGDSPRAAATATAAISLAATVAPAAQEPAPPKKKPHAHTTARPTLPTSSSSSSSIPPTLPSASASAPAAPFSYFPPFPPSVTLAPAWISTPITVRAQQTLKDYTQTLAQQQHIKFQMQRVQQQLQQQMQQSHAVPANAPGSAPSLYNQHAQLLYRLQQLDTHMINLSQSMLKQLSFAECYGQQPTVAPSTTTNGPTGAADVFAGSFMETASSL